MQCQHSDLGLAFISLSEFVFGASTGLISSRDEYAKKRFAKTKRFHQYIYNFVLLAQEDDEDLGRASKGQCVLLRPTETSLLGDFHHSTARDVHPAAEYMSPRIFPLWSVIVSVHI